MSFPLLQLSAEVILRVITFADLPTTAALARTCKLLRVLCLDEQVWHHRVLLRFGAESALQLSSQHEAVEQQTAPRQNVVNSQRQPIPLAHTWRRLFRVLLDDQRVQGGNIGGAWLNTQYLQLVSATENSFSQQCIMLNYVWWLQLGTTVHSVPAGKYNALFRVQFTNRAQAESYTSLKLKCTYRVAIPSNNSSSSDATAGNAEAASTSAASAASAEKNVEIAGVLRPEAVQSMIQQGWKTVFITQSVHLTQPSTDVSLHLEDINSGTEKRGLIVDYFALRHVAEGTDPSWIPCEAVLSA